MYGHVTTRIIVLLAVSSVRSQLLFQGPNGNGQTTPDLEAIAENLFREGGIPVPTHSLTGNEAMQELQRRISILNMLGGNFNQAVTTPSLLSQYSNFVRGRGLGTGVVENGGTLFGEQGLPAAAFAGALTSTPTPFIEHARNGLNQPITNYAGDQAFQVSGTTASPRQGQTSTLSPSRRRLFEQLHNLLIEKLAAMSSSSDRSKAITKGSEVNAMNGENRNQIQGEHASVQKESMHKNTIPIKINTNLPQSKQDQNIKSTSKISTREIGGLSRTGDIQQETFRKASIIPPEQALARNNILSSAFKHKPKSRHVSHEPELSTVQTITYYANAFNVNNGTSFQQLSDGRTPSSGQTKSQEGTYNTLSNGEVLILPLGQNESVSSSPQESIGNGHQQSHFRRDWKPPSRNSPAYTLLSKLHKTYQSPVSSNMPDKSVNVLKSDVKSPSPASNAREQTILKDMVQNGKYPISPHMSQIIKMNRTNQPQNGDQASQVYQFILTLRLPNASLADALKKLSPKTTAIDTLSYNEPSVIGPTMQAGSGDRIDISPGTATDASNAEYIGQKTTDVRKMKSININRKQNTLRDNQFDRSNEMVSPISKVTDTNSRYFGAGRLSEYDVNGSWNQDSVKKGDISGTSNRLSSKSQLKPGSALKNISQNLGTLEPENRVNSVPSRPSQAQVLSEKSTLNYTKYHSATTTSDGSKSMQMESTSNRNNGTIRRQSTSPKTKKTKYQTIRSKTLMPTSAKRFDSVRQQTVKLTSTLDKHADNTAQQSDKTQIPNENNGETSSFQVDKITNNSKQKNDIKSRHGMATLTKSQNVNNSVMDGTRESVSTVGTNKRTPRTNKAYTIDKAKRMQYLKRIRNLVDKELNLLVENATTSMDTSDTNRSESKGVSNVIINKRHQTRNSRPRSSETDYHKLRKHSLGQSRSSNSGKMKYNQNTTSAEENVRRRKKMTTGTVSSKAFKSKSLATDTSNKNTANDGQTLSTKNERTDGNTDNLLRNPVTANKSNHVVKGTPRTNQVKQSNINQKSSVVTGESSLNLATLNELLVNTAVPGTMQSQNQRLAVIMATLTATLPERAAASPGGKCSLAPICGHDGVTYFSECLLPPTVEKTCEGYCPCSFKRQITDRLTEHGTLQDTQRQAQEQGNIVNASNKPEIHAARHGHTNHINANGKPAQYITTPKADVSNSVNEATIYQTSNGGYATNYQTTLKARSNTRLNSQGLEKVTNQAVDPKGNTKLASKFVNADNYPKSSNTGNSKPLMTKIARNTGMIKMQNDNSAGQPHSKSTETSGYDVAPDIAAIKPAKLQPIHTTGRQEYHGTGKSPIYQDLKSHGVSTSDNLTLIDIDANPSPEGGTNVSHMLTSVANKAIHHNAQTIETVRQPQPQILWRSHASPKSGNAENVQSTTTAADATEFQSSQDIVSKAIAALQLLKDLRANGFQVLPGDTGSMATKPVLHRDTINVNQASATIMNGNDPVQGRAEHSQGKGTSQYETHSAATDAIGNPIEQGGGVNGNPSGAKTNGHSANKGVNKNISTASGLKPSAPKARVTLLSICVKMCQTHVYDPVCSTTGNSFTNNCYLMCSGEKRMCNSTCPCDFDNLPPRQRQKLAASYSQRAHAVNMDPLEMAEVAWFEQRCACALTDKLHVCTHTGQTSTRCMAQCNSQPIQCHGKCPCQ